MNLTKEQIGLALQSGLELLGPESEVNIPVKLNDGVFLLKQLLGSIASGQIGLSNAVQQEGPTDPPNPSNRKTRRTAASKKRSKKKVAKKTTRKKVSRKKS